MLQHGLDELQHVAIDAMSLDARQTRPTRRVQFTGTRQDFTARADNRCAANIRVNAQRRSAQGAERRALSRKNSKFRQRGQVARNGGAARAQALLDGVDGVHKKHDGQQDGHQGAGQ